MSEAGANFSGSLEGATKRWIGAVRRLERVGKVKFRAKAKKKRKIQLHDVKSKEP